MKLTKTRQCQHYVYLEAPRLDSTTCKYLLHQPLHVRIALLTFIFFNLYSGVIRALLHNKCLPKIITGTSAGSLIAAMIGTRTDSEVADILKPELSFRLHPCTSPFWKKMRRLWETGAMFDVNEWAEDSQWAARGNLTFLEAYLRTGRWVGLTIADLSAFAC